MRRSTPLEAAYPSDSEFERLAAGWWKALSGNILLRIWEGYDLALETFLRKIAWDQPLEDIERQITSIFQERIQQRLTGFEPFYCQHGAYESETRAAAPAQPPAYDIAFVLRANERLKWPVEAKVLQTATAVGGYVDDLRANFLTGRYGPFCGEGAMIGYLRSGEPDQALVRIGHQVGSPLAPHAEFPERSHGVSRHMRAVPEGKNWVRSFDCHHLIMPLQQ